MGMFFPCLYFLYIAPTKKGVNMNFFHYFISACTVLIITVVVFALLIFVGYCINKQKCMTKYHAFEPVYSFWGGCQIELNGKLTPVEAIRTTDL